MHVHGGNCKHITHTCISCHACYEGIFIEKKKETKQKSEKMYMGEVAAKKSMGIFILIKYRVLYKN